MLTKQDFIQQYEKHSDEELYQMYLRKDNYSEEGQEALNEVIDQKGGLARLEKLIEQSQKVFSERLRIQQETERLAVSHNDDELVFKLVSSDILTEEEVKEIISARLVQLKHQRRDQSITSRTIWGSLFGSVLAAILGGVIWGLQLIQMHRIFWILAIGLFLLSYGLIKWLTKQSKNNTVVLVASLLATIGGIGLGFVLYEMAG